MFFYFGTFAILINLVIFYKYVFRCLMASRKCANFEWTVKTKDKIDYFHVPHLIFIISSNLTQENTQNGWP